MINILVAREKSTLEHRCNNVPRTGENVARAQPSVSHEEAEIQNSNFEHVPSKRPSEDPEEDDRKPAAKRIKKEPEDDAQSVTQDEPRVETIVKPWEDKKDYVEHMEEGPEQNKEWEHFWWTVDEDMFTDVMKTKIEELIDEKLNQEFPEEVEIRENQDFDSEEEMTSETEDTDDDESETNNANVNNYLDSANMVMNLETAMKIAEEEDLWIGDSGASSHMMGSEEHVFNKKLITGSMRTANGAHMKMLCEGDINVDVITKNGDVTSGTLRVKVIPGMKQKLFSFTQAMMGGWTMQGGHTKQGELFIALTHEDHKPIIFDRVLKAGNSVLLAAKMVIRNPEEVNAAIVNGKQSKEYLHRVTGHAGHHLMDATAKYYKVDLTGKVNNCLSYSLEKIRQKNIPKKNEDMSKNPGERMYLDISSMRKPSMGGRQHWVMLVDEATKYKKSFFLKKKNERVEPIIDWIKALKARHKIQVKIIRCDNAGENKVLERESDKKELGIIFEYTAPGTPQQNGVVERAFVTLMGRARAMMNHAGFTMAKR